MSALYAKQLEWKKSSSTRSKAANTKDNKDMTFQPTFFTSKDTVRKFPVSERVGALTAQAGDTHVDRFAKARQMKEEAERKVLGKKASKNHSSQGGGLTAPVATQAAHSGYASTVQSQPQPHASGGGGGGGSYRDGRATTGEEHEGEGSLLQSTPASSSNAHTRSSTHSPQRADREENAVVYNTEQTLRAELALAHTNTAAADQAAEECAAREYSLMELLERERKEWHVERVKLVQCIHLQQLELASRASAAQETAVTIAKEFAATIERYEERLLEVESRTQTDMAEIKALLVARR